MPTFIEVMPTFTNDSGEEVFPLSPGAKSGDEYIDGTVRVEWFKKAFPDIATASVNPLTQTRYEALKAIGDCWKINAINWRKNGVFEVYNIPADEVIQEEEDFLLEMYPPKTEEQPTEEA